MPLTKTTISQKGSWAALPTELQEHILRFLLHDGCSLARFATVSEQWRAIIERHNFQHVKLSFSRVPQLGSMTVRAQALVKSIWLTFELREYGCSCHRSQRTFETYGLRKKESLLRKAFRALFLTLGEWDPQGDLKLDLTIHSPSDSHYWFKYLSFEPDFPVPPSQPSFVLPNDPAHGWVYGKLTSAPKASALRTVFESNPIDTTGLLRVENQWWNGLPQVPAVKTLIIRLQNRRQWSPSMLAAMLPRLPSIEEFYYEPWRAWDPSRQADTDELYCSFFDSLAMSTSLKKLVVFENFDEQYALAFKRCQRMREVCLKVTRALFKASLELEHLSASFVTGADHFLQAVEPGWKWPHLQSLTLTSTLLDAQSNPGTVNTMLQAVASTALSRMPKLRTFEVWHGRVGSAALFSYRVDEHGYTRISWKATWRLTLDSCVIKGWESVARAHGHTPDFRVHEFVDETANIHSHADAICFLGMSKVLRPVSLQQILRAHEIRREGIPRELAINNPPSTSL
ncbi:hypothetical protein PFICI_00255 [Pestalotiopsis fici W106-1]|uniref:F-box domain-containing protein n=1 Tax=Pestalotiopsis fici (strain W106-1 / CGMCC3.15140) TaxID=1229662 RepID=W3XLT1_PESFW|nr:uncharacterized protein PFICI_00255 [Pestalotiopsis fici W106-1]ETS86427.1 hypothetical protein PFICI_00255 [Pestalotiopsis fici W106-1]